MKKILIIIPLALMSCGSDPQQPVNCECYQQNQEFGAGGVWYNTDQSSTFTELCDKNGDTVYVSMMKRYIWKCQ